MSLIVLAGPAGVGKGTLVKWLVEHDRRFMLSVSATTRRHDQQKLTEFTTNSLPSLTSRH